MFINISDILAKLSSTKLHYQNEISSGWQRATCDGYRKFFQIMAYWTWRNGVVFAGAEMEVDGTFLTSYCHSSFLSSLVFFPWNYSKESVCICNGFYRVDERISPDSKQTSEGFKQVEGPWLCKQIIKKTTFNTCCFSNELSRDSITEFQKILYRERLICTKSYITKLNLLINNCKR